MGEKALKIANDEILKTIVVNYPGITNEEATRLSEEVLEAIDWNNTALMHKGIAWITKAYIKRKE